MKKHREQIAVASVATPFGSLTLAAGERGLFYVALPGPRPAEAMKAWLARQAPGADVEKGGRAAEPAARQIEEFFRGRRRSFDLPLDLRGTTFQKEVWNVLAGIPYGGAATYGEVARRVGRPGAARAVGAACGANPLPVVIPCHRVVGSGGSLTGFGGGLAMKRALLEFEGCRFRESGFLLTSSARTRACSSPRQGTSRSSRRGP